MNYWIVMIETLSRQVDSRQPLAEWLVAAQPGQMRLVRCATPTDKTNVQSRVNRIVQTHGVSAAATRLKEGVMVERL